MKKVLIIGGAGFIGTNLVEYLLEYSDYEIVVLDNLSTGGLSNLLCLDLELRHFEFIQGDVRSTSEVQEVCDSCDYIVNLAAQVSVLDSFVDPVYDLDVNVNGTLNVLECAKRSGTVKKVIQISSVATLGDAINPINESTIACPLSPYGISKLTAEHFCRILSSNNLKTTVLRFSNVYGPHSTNASGIIPLFIRNVIDNKPIYMYGDGKQTRDFIHAYDICKAIHLALENNLSNNFNLFQIGTGEETSILELFGFLTAKCLNINLGNVEILQQSAQEGEIIKNYCDITKASKELKYKPSIRIKQGLADTVEWFKKYYYKEGK